MEKTVAAVRAALSDELRKPQYGGSHPMTGHCYVACEALYHLTGKRLKPHVIRLSPDLTHWFLKTPGGGIVDPTGDQFDFTVDYSRGRGCGFLTSEPSKRAQVVIDRVNFKKYLQLSGKRRVE